MDDRYYLAVGSEQKGPYTFSQLQSMWRSGAITADVLYTQEGFDEWVAISTLSELLDPKPERPANSVSAQHPALSRSFGSESDKHILPALILYFFFGIFGVHAFYAGRPKQGCIFLALWLLPVLAGMLLPFDLPIQLILVGLIIMTIIDFIRIVSGTYQDAEGRRITRWT
jgi:TM2 domain-containing membrane protein YozV